MTDYRDELGQSEADKLGASDPNVAANRTSDQPVDHEALMGEPVDENNAALDAERAATEGAAESDAEDGRQQ